MNFEKLVFNSRIREGCYKVNLLILTWFWRTAFRRCDCILCLYFLLLRFLNHKLILGRKPSLLIVNLVKYLKNRKQIVQFNVSWSMKNQTLFKWRYFGYGSENDRVRAYKTYYILHKYCAIWFATKQWISSKKFMLLQSGDIENQWVSIWVESLV